MKHNDNTPNTATMTLCLHDQQQSRLKSSLEIKKHVGHSHVKDKTISVYDVDYEPTILKFSMI